MSIWKGEEGGLPAVVYHERQGNSDSPTTNTFDDQLRIRIINAVFLAPNNSSLAGPKYVVESRAAWYARASGERVTFEQLRCWELTQSRSRDPLCRQKLFSLLSMIKVVTAFHQNAWLMFCLAMLHQGLTIGYNDLDRVSACRTLWQERNHMFCPCSTCGRSASTRVSRSCNPRALASLDSKA